MTTEYFRRLTAGQRARIRVWDRATGEIRTVHESADRLYEAPNWMPDDRLLVNGDGLLWTLPADGSAPPEQLPTPGLPQVNNDHVLSPDGATIYASTSGDWHIWRLPATGGAAERVTPADGAMHFLHAVDPTGSRLAYVSVREHDGRPWGSATIRTIGVDGTDDRPVTTDPGPADGPEWTPDGEWILFNTESFTEAAGHAQLARIRADGTGLERLAADERVNWFPHVAPAGDVAVYLSYPPGTTGHPADLPVELRLVTTDAWGEPTTVVALDGGQGTINVPSWRADGGAFAFVDYPVG